MAVNRLNPKNTRRASDFATLADVSQIVAAAIVQYHYAPWYKKLWLKLRKKPEPPKVPGLRW